VITSGPSIINPAGLNAHGVVLFVALPAVMSARVTGNEHLVVAVSPALIAVGVSGSQIPNFSYV
jgi:hypothetical protein